MADGSLQRLEGLQPEMRKLAEKAFAKASAQKVDVFVVSALRTYAEQQALYAAGSRRRRATIVTNAKPGESYHNFGLAFDFAVVKNGRAVWDENHPDWKAFVAIGKGLGLEWGGDWSTFKDYPHLQQGNAPSLASLRKEFPHGWRGADRARVARGHRARRSRTGAGTGAPTAARGSSPSSSGWCWSRTTGTSATSPSTPSASSSARTIALVPEWERRGLRVTGVVDERTLAGRRSRRGRGDPTRAIPPTAPAGCRRGRSPRPSTRSRNTSSPTGRASSRRCAAPA